jgi:hypothetical protein
VKKQAKLQPFKWGENAMSGYLKGICSVAFALTLLSATVSVCARAQDAPPPERLIIGYEDEGKVDISLQACVAWVKEDTEGWKQADIEEAARKICAARKRHIEAYEVLQNNYRILMQLAAQDVRLSPAKAAENLKIIVKARIDHKNGLTTGGHNVMVPVIENDIIAKCLAWTASLLRDDIHELRSHPT